MTISERKIGWLTPEYQAGFRDILTSATSSHGIVIPTYCLMPDHIHILAAGTHATANQKLWSRAVRRELNLLLNPAKLQRQPYDHVLRPEEQKADSFATLVYYICNNPVRARLVANAQEWSYSGAVVPDLPNLQPHSSTFHECWWDWWNHLQA